uniref:Integral membrane protein n=1 Tax=Magnetococcus massalia (strain MO-1) TaxID=451514 RepID=A0A1S7LG34_MAGMO|nr:membrane protein of unknown function [Candidatus Magnetococcus massalia]
MKHHPFIYSLLLSLLLVAILLQWVGFDIAQCEEYLSALDGGVLLLITLLFLLRQWIRTLRLRVMIGQQKAGRGLFAVALQQQFLLTFIPFRMGELALPVLLKRRGVPMAQTLAVLLVIRSMDLLAMALYLLILLQLSLHYLPFDLAVANSVLLFLIALLTLLAGALLYGARRWPEGHVELLNHPRVAWLPKRFWLAERLSVFIQSIAQLPNRAFVMALLFSPLLLLTSGLMMVLFFANLEPHFSWQASMLGEVLMSLVNLLPIQGVAAVGTFEGTFVMIYGSMGVVLEKGLALAVTIHLVHVVLNLFSGLLGVGLGRWQKMK